MLIGGILESITYEGKIEQYMPLIDFCSKAHLGYKPLSTGAFYPNLLKFLV